MPEGITPPHRPARPIRLVTLTLLVALLIVLGLFVWANRQRRALTEQFEQTQQQLEEVKNSSQSSGETAARELLEKVGRHIQIPLTPLPTVATITDIEKLKQVNAFYAAGKNGDNVIITQKRAILYDPKADVIIDVVPVAFTPRTSPIPTVSVVPPSLAPVSPSPVITGLTSTSPLPSPVGSATPSPAL